MVTEPEPGARFYKARIEGITEARVAGRGWAWAWTPTYGPVMLNIYLDRTLAEWEEWLAGLAPHGYTRDGESGIYKWGDSWLTLRPGRVQFMRGYHTPSAAVQWVDAGLLGSLRRDGLALGLIDGDYNAWMATGHTSASLANYLRADDSEERGDLRQHTVEAGSLRDDAAIGAAIATSFGLEAGTDILAWVRETSVRALPRTVTVNLPRDLSQMYETSPLLQGLALANARVFWSFRFGG